MNVFGAKRYVHSWAWEVGATGVLVVAGVTTTGESTVAVGAVLGVG